MKSKEEFKSFVRRHPELIKFVKSGEMNWQKFYELYNLYDEDDTAWNEYFSINHTENTRTTNNSSSSSFGMSDIMSMLKGIKPEVLQQNINSIQKFLGFVSDFVEEKTNAKTPSSRGIYTPRPTRKMFEDVILEEFDKGETNGDVENNSSNN